MTSYIQVAGKSNLLVGFPDDAYATLDVLGEQMDDTQLSIQHVLHEVPGDSQGGPQGDPIEQQILAIRVSGTFNLSKWDPEVRRQLIAHAAMGTEGHFSDSEIGALLHRDRSFRFVISPAKTNTIGNGLDDAGNDYYFYNFPCCTITSPIETGQGTKWSALRFQWRAWRVPAGHYLAPVDPTDGLIWNRDDTGVAAALGIDEPSS